jgi:hypothetical protein
MFAVRRLARNRPRPWAARRRRAGLMATLVAAALPIAGIGAASATTGPTYLLKPPKYSFPFALLKAYAGRYISTSVSDPSKISSSGMYIGVGASGYAVGGISIYAFSAQGNLETIVDALYNFHIVGGGVEADIVGAASGTGAVPVLGHVFFHHAGSSRNLVGTLQPPIGGSYGISYRFVSSGGGVPVSGNGQAATSPAKLHPGWGSTATSVGRYQLAGIAVSARPQPGAGIFTLAAVAANRLVVAARRPTGGELTLFLRKVKAGKPLVPSGILNIRSALGTNVLYLTDLRSAGAERAAVARGGSFLGPVIGRFTGTILEPGRMEATVQTSQLPTLTVLLSRFSSSPTQ